MTLHRQVFFQLALLALLMVLTLTGSASVFLARWHHARIVDSERRSLQILATHIQGRAMEDDPTGIRDLLNTFVQAGVYREYAFLEEHGKPMVWTFPGGVPPCLV